MGERGCGKYKIRSADSEKMLNFMLTVYILFLGNMSYIKQIKEIRILNSIFSIFQLRENQ